MTRLVIIVFLLLSVLFAGAQNNSKFHKDTNECFGSEDSDLGRLVYIIVDSMPEFPGGLLAWQSKFLKEFRYPSGQEDFQGSIYLNFIVLEAGQISSIKITGKAEEKYTLVDKEAVRVFSSMPAWNPGSCKGVKVPVRMYFPIKFLFDNRE